MKIAIAVFFMFFSACFSENRQKKTVEVQKGFNHENASPACGALTEIGKNLLSIIGDPKKYIYKNPDSCVIKLISEINQKAIIEENNDDYFLCLNKICEISDGYVSELLMNYTVTQFYSNAEQFLIYAQDSGKSACLRKFLVAGLSLELSMEEEENRINSEIYSMIDSNIKKFNANEKIVALLVALKKDIDPTKFD